MFPNFLSCIYEKSFSINCFKTAPFQIAESLAIIFKKCPGMVSVKKKQVASSSY